MDLKTPYMIIKEQYIKPGHTRPTIGVETADIHTLNFPILKTFITTAITGISNTNISDILDIWLDLSEKIKNNQPNQETLYIIGVSPLAIESINKVNPKLAHFYKHEINSLFYKSIYLIEIHSNNTKTKIKAYDITRDVTCNLDLFKDC
jgi:hypothetical protein